MNDPKLFPLMTAELQDPSYLSFMESDRRKKIVASIISATIEIVILRSVTELGGTEHVIMTLINRRSNQAFARRRASMADDMCLRNMSEYQDPEAEAW